MNKKLVFSVSILIPVAGLKTIKETIESLEPIFWVIYTVLLIEKNMLSFLTMVFVGYVLLQIGLAIFAAYIDTEKNMGSLLRWIPKLILTTIEEMVLQIPIMAARVVGMLTFHWRRLVW